MTKTIIKPIEEIQIPFPSQFEKLSEREQKFVLGKLQGMTNVDAALQAGYTRNTALVKSHLFMRRETIRLALGLTLSQLGLDVNKILQPVLDGLKATRTQYIGRGEHARAITTPDYNIRLKASSLALRLLEWEADHTQKDTVFDDDEITEANKLMSQAEKPSEIELRKQARIKQYEKLDDVQLVDAVFSELSTEPDSIKPTK